LIKRDMVNYYDNMKSQFLSFEQALELYHLGFDGPGFACYNTDGHFFIRHIDAYCMGADDYCSNSHHLFSDRGIFIAPLKQQVFAWFREKHDLFGCVDLQACTPSHWYIRVDKIEINDYLYHSEDEHLRFDTYEKAETACIQKLIEIVKN